MIKALSICLVVLSAVCASYATNLDDELAKLESDYTQNINRFFWEAQKKADALGDAVYKKMSNQLSIAHNVDYTIRRNALEQGKKAIESGKVPQDLVPLFTQRLRLRASVSGLSFAESPLQLLHVLIRDNVEKPTKTGDLPERTQFALDIFKQRLQHGVELSHTSEEAKEEELKASDSLAHVDDLIDEVMGCENCSRDEQPDEDQYFCAKLFKSELAFSGLVPEYVDAKLLQAIQESQASLKGKLAELSADQVSTVDTIDMADLAWDFLSGAGVEAPEVD